MKTLTVVLVVVLVAGSLGYIIKVPEAQNTVRTTSNGWLHIQKLLLPLFENVCEASTNPIVVRNAQDFNLDVVGYNYVDPDIINNFRKLYSSNNQLPKGEIFTELNQDHMYELKLVYEVLYNAPNFDTFYKAACWIRQNTNCGLFVNAIYLAILKRRDTENITVPAPYELLPNYFIRQDVIIKASTLLAGGDVTSEGMLNEGNAYILDANYTANIDADDETKLAYFYEDIGLNSYYFLKRLNYAPWFHYNQVEDTNFGEYLYHFLKQLVARYNLERYANGLMFLDNVDWKTCRVAPYDSMLIFSNGVEFSYRNSVVDSNSPINAVIQNIEDTISSVIPPMIQNGDTKTQIINNLMAILVSNMENYEFEARSYLGGGTDENRWRSVLAHHMTSLRDPVFWMINKKIVDMVDDSLKSLPGYTKTELFFPGVKISNVEVKKVMTMFEPFAFEVTDALKSSAENPMFQVNIVQNRLNHKPFTVKLNITSLINQKGLVQLYLGPKILPGEFAMKKDLFMMLDKFEINLKIGSNVISRTSSAFENISEDFTSLSDLRKLIEDAEFGLDVKPLKSVKTLTGFPSRLILPKGTPEGLPMQLLAFVAPYTKVTAGGISLIPKTEFNSATLSPGYPFDLDFDDKQFFALPNVMIKDIIVTHKENKGSSRGGPGEPKNWYGGDSSDSYGPSREPYAANLKNTAFEEVSDSNGAKREAFDYNLRKSQYGKNSGANGPKREPYDTTLRKSQYGKTDDYAAKRGSYYKSKNEEVKDTISTTENDKLEDKENLNTDVLQKVDVIPNYITGDVPTMNNNDDELDAGLNVGGLSDITADDNYEKRQFLTNVLSNVYVYPKEEDHHILPSMYSNDYVYE